MLLQYGPGPVHGTMTLVITGYKEFYRVIIHPWMWSGAPSSIHSGGNSNTLEIGRIPWVWRLKKTTITRSAVGIDDLRSPIQTPLYLVAIEFVGLSFPVGGLFLPSLSTAEFFIPILIPEEMSSRPTVLSSLYMPRSQFMWNPSRRRGKGHDGSLYQFFRNGGSPQFGVEMDFGEACGLAGFRTHVHQRYRLKP